MHIATCVAFAVFTWPHAHLITTSLAGMPCMVGTTHAMQLGQGTAVCLLKPHTHTCAMEQHSRSVHSTHMGVVWWHCRHVCHTQQCSNTTAQQEAAVACGTICVHTARREPAELVAHQVWPAPMHIATCSVFALFAWLHARLITTVLSAMPCMVGTTHAMQSRPGTTCHANLHIMPACLPQPILGSSTNNAGPALQSVPSALRASRAVHKRAAMHLRRV